MPKSDTWPGGVTMEPSSNLDSAGSCDSVISMNSGYSEDSMEHLSPEERACLMYLEETIEALEVQEDSGISNDEPDPGSLAGNGGRMRNDVSSFKADESDPDPGSRESTIEDEAEYSALNQTPEPQPESSNADGRIRPSATELCVSTDGNGHLKIVPSASLCQTNEACDGDLDVIPPPVDFMDEPGLRPQIVRHLPPSAGISNNKPTIDLEQLRQRASGKRTSVDQVPPNKPPNLSLPAITSDPLMTPPPDEPRSPPTVAPKPKRLPANIILKSHKVTVGFDDHSEHSVPTGRDRLSLDPQRVRIEALRKLGLLPAGADSGPVLSPKLSPKTRRSWAAPPSPISPGAPQTPPFTPSYSRVHSSPPACFPPQSPAAPPACLPPQSPAATPPPARLPPQSPAATPPPARLPLQSPAATPPPARVPLQSPAATPPPARLPPQSPAATPPPARLPPQSPAAPPACLPLQSPAAPPARLPPQSPAAPPACLPLQSPAATPPPARLPPQSPAATPPPARLPLQSPAAPSPPAGDPVEVLPAPAAFSDPVGPPLSYNEVKVNARVNTPPLTPPSLVKHLTPPKGVGVKSATLERSGLGLSSYMADQDSNKTGQASQLRNNRARPASLGGGTEFTSAAGGEVSLAGHGAAAGKEPDLRRLLPAHNALQHSRDSQKLPRSQGISVLICPRSENGEDRREALKKLGLIRD